MSRRNENISMEPTEIGFMKVTEGLYAKSPFILRRSHMMTWDFVVIDEQLEGGFHVYREGFFLKPNVEFIQKTIRDYKLEELLK